jgi:outer membrane protein OmpA-like peptidoglycan-associated protein
LNSAQLRKESYPELSKLAELMTLNPTIRIEIGGHTDTRGDEKENLKLSAERARAVLEFLLTKGIDPKRMDSKGYGESKPVYSDSLISSMKTEDEKEKSHQMNRRTEYRIIN